MLVVTTVPVTGLWSPGPEDIDPDAMAGNGGLLSGAGGLKPSDLEVSGMWQSVVKAVGVAAMATTLAMLVPGTATAAGAGEAFGQHVRTCQQTMGFDGVHNPGMHHGFAGWDPSHVC